MDERAQEFPLLIFPTHHDHARASGSGGPSEITFPSMQRQRRRLAPQFRSVAEALRLALQETPEGADPDLVLVLEIAGSVAQFMNAARRVPGLEWIGEWADDELLPDEDFHDVRAGHEADTISRSFFLLFSNRTAVREMQGLWRQYSRDQNIKLPYGLNKWKAVFDQLRTIRVWNENDRVPPELFEDWSARLEFGEGRVPFEAELWFHQDSAKREIAEQTVRSIVERSGGEVLRSTVLPEIRYHALVGQIPLAHLPDLRQDAIQLFRSKDVQYVRPVAQAFETVSPVELEELPREPDRPLPDPQLPPIVAVLDGLPIEAHPLLNGRIVVDDPDDWAPEIPAAERNHGTAMASLVALGDLSLQEQPLQRRIYIRPILKPSSPPWAREPREAVPDTFTFVDIVHRAITRLFTGEPPAAGSVVIVNLSVGDLSRIFDRVLSPCARLLDWLAWTYRVLFLVSAGNHSAPLRIDLPRGTLARQHPDSLTRAIVLGLEMDSINRRLLSPAESINALTIASLYEDSSAPAVVPHRQLAYGGPLPSPYNAHGFGYRRAVKPDLLFRGGRVLIGETLGNQYPEMELEMFSGVGRAPGQRVAAPPARPLSSSTNFSRGTSNACAIATRAAAKVFEFLNAPGSMATDEPFTRDYTAVLIKALLVHGAAWGAYRDVYEATLAHRYPGRYAGDFLARYFGFGEADIDRAISCRHNKVTVLGYGSVSAEQAHIFEFPLPPALSAQHTLRRFTVTLAWLSPINPANYQYRKAKLWFSFPEAEADQTLLAGRTRTEVHHKPGTRGTVQHEIFSGENALVFGDDHRIRIWVNCTAEAGSFDFGIPYCLVASLETPQATQIPIYQQVAARIRPPVRVRA